MMKKIRESTVNTLVSAGGLNKPSAENYEKAIYGLSCRLNTNGQWSKETYVKIAFDKLGQLITAKDRTAREKILSDIRSDVVGWDACAYDTQRDAYNAATDRSVLKPTAVKGLYKCKNKDCGSDEFYVWSQQTRSCDEAATNFRQCAKCGKRGRE